MLLPMTLQLRNQMHLDPAAWFILLALLSIFLILYTFWRKKDFKLVLLQLSVSAIAGFLEVVIFIWLRSYQYFPHILKNPYYDMALGAFLSQILYVSSVAVFIAAFNLGYGWILLLAVMFMGIELLFLTLGIYKLNWWRPIYTGIGLVIYFWIAKKWYRGLIYGLPNFMQLFTLFCVNYILFAYLIVIPTFTGRYQSDFGWLENPISDTLVVVSVFCIIRGFMLAVICFYQLHWKISAVVLLFMWISYFLLSRMELFRFKQLWDLLFFAAIDLLVLLCSYYFKRVLVKQRM